MCKCVEERRDKLEELGLENVRFKINDKSIYKTYSEYTHGKRKTAIVNHIYCPFCGKKYEGA